MYQRSCGPPFASRWWMGADLDQRSTTRVKTLTTHQDEGIVIVKISFRLPSTQKEFTVMGAVRLIRTHKLLSSQSGRCEATRNLLIQRSSSGWADPVGTGPTESLIWPLSLRYIATGSRLCRHILQEDEKWRS